MPDGAPITPGSGVVADADEITFALTGTVAKNGTATLTGTSTLFLSELAPGMVIRVPGTANEDRIVLAIASDTSLTVTVAFTNTASGQTGLRVVQRQRLANLWDQGSFTGTFNLNGTFAGPFDCLGMSGATLQFIWGAGTPGAGRALPQVLVAGVWVGVIMWRIDQLDPATNDGVAAVANATQNWRCQIPPGATQIRVLAIFDMGISTTVNIGVGSQPDTGVVLMGAPTVQTRPWFVRPRKLATYSASFRIAARPYALSSAMTANSRKQYATLHHAASSTKTARLRRIFVEVHGNTVAAILHWELVRILTVAPATGNPAITPARAENSDAAPDTTCLALPTTAGTEGDRYSSRSMNLGVVGAAPTTNPPPFMNGVDLLDPANLDDEEKLPAIRAGILEGWAVILDANAATTVTAVVSVSFTEE